MYDIELPFLDTTIRRELLSEGLSEYRVKLFEGSLPSVLAIMLIDPKSFDGSYDQSSLKFHRNNLTSLEVVVDGTSISSHPIKMENGNSLNFFVEYLRRTNRFHNLLSAKTLEKSDFDDSNFIIFVNLKHEGFRNGQCAAFLKFSQELDEKLFLLTVPISERKLRFDSYMNTTLV